MSGTIGSIEVKCHVHMSRMAMFSIIHLIEPVQLCNKMVHFQWNGFATEICLLLCLVLKQFSCFVHLSIHSFMLLLLLFFVIIFYLYVTSFVQMSETVETCRVHWESEWESEWVSERNRIALTHGAIIAHQSNHYWSFAWDSFIIGDWIFNRETIAVWAMRDSPIWVDTARHGTARHHTAHLYRLNLNLNSNL